MHLLHMVIVLILENHLMLLTVAYLLAKGMCVCVCFKGS